MALGDITYLQNQITSTNKLSADLLDASSASSKETIVNAITFNTAYDASSNKAATMADINTAIFNAMNDEY